MSGCLKRLIIGITALFGLGVGLIIVLFWPVDLTRYSDQTGNYVVGITSPLSFSGMPGTPGQGSDRPGEISICDREGNFYGSHPLEMLQNGYAAEWTDTGASLPFVGEWTFDEKSGSPE